MRSSIVVDNPRAASPAFVFLVIVAVPSGGRLWLASRREKQTEERRTERQEETGGDRGGQSDRDRRGRYFPLREGGQRGHPGELNMSAKRKATAIMQHHKVSPTRAHMYTTRACIAT